MLSGSVFVVCDALVLASCYYASLRKGEKSVGWFPFLASLLASLSFFSQNIYLCMRKKFLIRDRVREWAIFDASADISVLQSWTVCVFEVLYGLLKEENNFFWSSRSWVLFFSGGIKHFFSCVIKIPLIYVPNLMSELKRSFISIEHWYFLSLFFQKQ